MENRIELYVEREMYANGWQRFGSFIIDFIVFYISMFTIGIILGLLTYFGIDGPLIWITEHGEAAEGKLLGVTLYLTYYFISEALGQRTVGKLITGTKVVMEDGTKPPAAAIALRSLCRLIPFEYFTFFGEYSRGWHDSFSKTFTVDVKRFKAAMALKSSFEEIGAEQSNNL